MAYSKTEIGQRSFKDRSVPLTPRQRAAFILFDGRRGLSEVMASTSGLGVTAADIDHMLQMGLLEGTPAASSAAPSRPMPLEPRAGSPDSLPPNSDFVSSDFLAGPPGARPPPAPTSTPQERYQRAYLIATKLTASLGLRGFRLNLAVEAAGSYEQLLELAPKIREAVGPEKFKPLDAALKG